ncbi:MAG: hypothetical protein GKS06_07935 [Acidobacteria bacterium]|nr:hypothetical protein [Acidobacteriota bacterium]
MKLRIALLACGLALSVATIAIGSQSTADSPYWTITDNVLERPEGYRKWVFVGEPVTPNDMNGGAAPFPEFHTVYIDPESYDHYASTGEFRDGTILIKELVSVGSKEAVSGNGYFMGEFIGLEATIKSSRHFPDEPGNWAYFSFTNAGGPTNPTAEPFPTASCNSCHQLSAADDFVFTQYYPVLRAAKGSGPVAEAPQDPWQPTAPTPATSDGLPVSEAALFEYLQDGGYGDFEAKESRTHPGRGPHTSVTSPVRVFYNDILASSMEANNAEHPRGASAVKEMFTADGQPQGWAVMVKTHDETDEGRGWYWYEVTSDTDSSALAANGNGVPGCIACHSFRDQDLILSGFPLR